MQAKRNDDARSQEAMVKMKKLALLFAAMLLASVSAYAQSYQEGKILKWDTESYGKHGDVTRNAAVYYIQVGKTVYQVTRGTTRADRNLETGQQVQCRIESDHMFIPGEKRKEMKYLIIGSSEAR